MAIDTGSSEIAGPQHVIDHLADKRLGFFSLGTRPRAPPMKAPLPQTEKSSALSLSLCLVFFSAEAEHQELQREGEVSRTMLRYAELSLGFVPSEGLCSPGSRSSDLQSRRASVCAGGLGPFRDV